MKRLRRRLGEERGEGLITGLILLAGVLIPLLFVIPLFARLEQGRLAAAQAARDAVRSAVESPSSGQAQAAADAALARAREQTGEPLRLTLDGQFARGGLLHAKVSTALPLGHLPGLGDFGTVTVSAQASAPVDRYRSLLPAAGP